MMSQASISSHSSWSFGPTGVQEPVRSMLKYWVVAVPWLLSMPMVTVGSVMLKYAVAY